MQRTIKRNKQQADPYTTEGRYVHREAPGVFQAYDNGWSEGRAERTYSAAADHLFPWFGHGGYILTYYPIDGDDISVSLCANCARDEWLANPAQEFIVESSDSDSKYERAEWCDGCNTEIVPQCCPECGEAIDNELPQGVMSYDHDYHIMHARCLARLVVEGRATKTGKLTYYVKEFKYDAERKQHSPGHWANGEYRGKANANG